MAGGSAGRRRGQGGETLIEVLLATGIFFVVGMAALGGLWASTAATAQHQASGRAEALVRSAAEWLQSPTTAYVPRAGCEGSATYEPPPVPTTAPGFEVVVASVAFRQGAPAAPVAVVDPAFSPTCPDGPDPGLQAVTLEVRGPAEVVSRVTVLKREP